MVAVLHKALRVVGHQHWIPRGRAGFLRLMANPARVRPRPFEVDFFGVRYSGNLGNYIDWNTYFQGGYALEELHVLAAICAKLSGPIHYYDIGANVGHHTLFMSRLATSVTAFEPYPVVREEMARKLAVAGARNVSIQPVALGERDDAVTLNLSAGPNQGTNSIVYVPGNSAGESISVQLARGDDYIAAHNLPPISLLKIDVEGYEAAALAGLRQTLLRDRPPMLIEIFGDDRSGFQTEDNLRAALYPGATIYEIGAKAGGYRLKPFNMATAREILVLPEGLTL